jgi:phosphoribosylanthranilate isomerase
MPAPAIKICGISTPEAIDAAVAARADWIGLNFYPSSPRHVSAARAAELAAHCAGRARMAGVFVDPDDHLLGEAIAAAARLDAIQLHGSESPARVAEVRARFGVPVWKVVAVASAEDVRRAAAYAEAADLVLFDAKTPKGALPGGMGLSFDWSLLSAWKDRAPWGLAGGLSPANVAEAARLTGAPLVDAASGVESAPGVKDPALIAAFCAAARSG